MGTPKYRADYKPLAYHIKHNNLAIDLDEHQTIVVNEMTVERTAHGTADSQFCLDGKALEFIGVKVDGRPLKPSEYEVDADHLTIYQLPAKCKVTIENRIDPTSNTSCEGLYRSEGIYTTQCESEGFRRITYYQDRPDNLATYTTTVVGDQKQNPLLLSNGNLIQQKVLADGRHMCVFEDPNPKPSYLFALVGGDLRTVKDYAFTQAGEKVDLNIHVKGHKVNKTLHAMDCLKAAFAWDEAKYGLPYDLNVYNIVGVPDFNAGAMENKGLNIFNDDSLLVSPQTSTDKDYQWIYTVVGHEFFHNYAGNRVTIRNWFELALKEGLATQKEREFLADQIGYTQPRIKDVTTLRAVQFPEDAGPTAHAVRTDSYEDISNFYTTTTYYKGSELLSMLSGLLGQDTWREGVREYFLRLDGTAATIDEFLEVLSDVSGKDLSQFALWYSQAGTPKLEFSEYYDEAKQTYSLTVKQSCDPTPGQAEKRPFHIPIKMGLLDDSGQDIPLRLKGERRAQGRERVLELTEAEQTFTFVGVKQKPTPSLLRDFSAPVKVGKTCITNDDLIFLMANDSNQFNRWDAAQSLHQRVLLQLVEDYQAGRTLSVPAKYIEATQRVLLDNRLLPGLKADIISLPTDGEMLEKMQSFDPSALSAVKEFVALTMTAANHKAWEQIYLKCGCRDEYSPENAGLRQLKNLTLGRLVRLGEHRGDNKYLNWANDQFLRTQNMTDRLGALTCVQSLDHALARPNAIAQSQAMMENFYQTWQHDPQVIDKWLGLQAQYDGPDTIEHMKRMLEHPAFSMTNPNNVRSLMRVFIRNNPKHFHDPTGAGYKLVADFLLALDPVNAHMAGDIAKNMVLTSNLDSNRQNQLCAQLTRLRDAKLSDGTAEIVNKALDGFKQVEPLLMHDVEDDAEVASPNIARVPEFVREAQSFIQEDDLSTLGSQTFLVQYGSASSASEPQPARRSARLARKR